MLETARIIEFPVRAWSLGLTLEQAALFARSYLEASPEDRSEETALADFEVLFAVCAQLRLERDVRPAKVAEEAAAIYRGLTKHSDRVGVFDEREYLLGESAFLAGCSYRNLGQHDEAQRWLDRSEAGFRNTVNPGPGLSNVAYIRLALRFEMGRYKDVLDLIPSLRASFEKLEMRAELAKCRLLEAMSLKACGRTGAALEVLEAVRTQDAVVSDSFLHARILTEMGDVHQLEGRIDQAMKAYATALPLLENKPPSLALADLQMFVGSVYRDQGQPLNALKALRSSIVTYAELQAATRVSYVRLLIADTLLALGRHREAEWEILAALPAIEQGKMVPEGLAAVALLKESVRLRKTDPNALRDLREHLQARN
jgi:tetratricopeptide (TPR) repeat protein